MKFTFSPSPNYHNSKSTSEIMKDLTMCLLAVTLYSVIYYCGSYGASYGLRVVLLMADAVACALITDALFFKVMKQDIVSSIRTSYSWVTAIILVLISRIQVSYFAIGVSTIIAVLFGKLVFGGFGQNIFNPAAFGEAVIMGNFTGSYSTDFATSATPTTVAKAAGWMIESGDFSSFISQYGSLGKMFLGQYPSTIGSTCGVLILLCLVFLIWQRDIDWQAPVFYIGTVFVVALLIGLMHGAGLSYALFSVLAGGVLFGGVFMLTDPVTSPVTIPGRIVFAVGAACLTLIIRDKSNLSDGVLFAILLMNMLTPAIDKLFDGNQIKDAAKFKKRTAIACACFAAVALLVGTSVTAKEAATADTSSSTAAAAATSNSLSGDYSANNASCTETSNDGTTAVYACTADGFGLINNMGDGYSQNEATVTVNLADNTVASVEVTSFGDTAGVGDLATADDALAAYTGLSLDDSVDAVSGATFTSSSVASMVQAALNAAAGN